MVFIGFVLVISYGKTSLNHQIVENFGMCVATMFSKSTKNVVQEMVHEQRVYPFKINTSQKESSVVQLVFRDFAVKLRGCMILELLFVAFLLRKFGAISRVFMMIFLETADGSEIRQSRWIWRRCVFFTKVFVAHGENW